MNKKLKRGLLIGLGVVSVVLVAGIATLMVFVVPAYDEYRARAVATNGILKAVNLKFSISMALMDAPELPPESESWGRELEASGDVRDVYVARNGAFSVRLSDGRELRLEPTRDTAGAVTWRCIGDPANYQRTMKLCS